jgi:hypothetical protein
MTLSAILSLSGGLWISTVGYLKDYRGSVRMGAAAPPRGRVFVPMRVETGWDEFK